MGNPIPVNPLKTAVQSVVTEKAETSGAEVYPTPASHEVEAGEKGYTLARRHMVHDMLAAQRCAEKLYSSADDTESPLSMEELLQHINNRLSQDGIKLCKSRNGRMAEDRGEFYAEIKGFLLARHVNPTTWGRELGILREDDTVFRI